MKEQLNLLLKRALSYFPTQLPVGTAQFDTFANDIIALAGNYADTDSMRFAIASMLIHAPHDKGSLSKHYFVVRLRKSAANQIASQVFQEIKTKQDAKNKPAEVTASNGTTPQNGKETAQ